MGKVKLSDNVEIEDVALYQLAKLCDSEEEFTEALAAVAHDMELVRQSLNKARQGGTLTDDEQRAVQRTEVLPFRKHVHIYTESLAARRAIYESFKSQANAEMWDGQLSLEVYMGILEDIRHNLGLDDENPPS